MNDALGQYVLQNTKEEGCLHCNERGIPEGEERNPTATDKCPRVGIKPTCPLGYYPTPADVEGATGWLGTQSDRPSDCLLLAGEGKTTLF